MLNDYPDVLSVQELAKILRIGKNAAYDLVKQQIITSRKVGRKYLIPKICIIAYLQGMSYDNTVMADESSCHIERSIL